MEDRKVGLGAISAHVDARGVVKRAICRSGEQRRSQACWACSANLQFCAEALSTLLVGRLSNCVPCWCRRRALKRWLAWREGLKGQLLSTASLYGRPAPPAIAVSTKVAARLRWEAVVLVHGHAQAACRATRSALPSTPGRLMCTGSHCRRAKQGRNAGLQLLRLQVQAGKARRCHTGCLPER